MCNRRQRTRQVHQKSPMFQMPRHRVAMQIRCRARSRAEMGRVDASRPSGVGRVALQTRVDGVDLPCCLATGQDERADGCG